MNSPHGTEFFTRGHESGVKKQPWVVVDDESGRFWLWSTEYAARRHAETLVWQRKRPMRIVRAVETIIWANTDPVVLSPSDVTEEPAHVREVREVLS